MTALPLPSETALDTPVGPQSSFRSPGLAHRSRDYLRASSRFVRACCCCSTISVSFERDEDHHIPAGEEAWIVWCEEVME
jgi:hypothetical protein